MNTLRRGTTSFPGGFTRLELAIVAGVVVLLAAAVVPALGRTKKRSDGTNCVYRLRPHLKNETWPMFKRVCGVECV
jgi:hypothetical protein